MVKVGTCNGYDFYLEGSLGDREAIYNIVPEGSEAPKGGYHNKTYIENIKGVIFPAVYNYKLWSSMTIEEKIKDCLLNNREDIVRRLQIEENNE